MGAAQLEGNLVEQGPLVIPLGLCESPAGEEARVAKRNKSVEPTKDNVQRDRVERQKQDVIFGLQVRRSREEILNSIATESSVIPRAAILQKAKLTESGRLRQELEALPSVTDLTAYDRIPPSQFGAAMLRGMGWQEGQSVGRKPDRTLPKLVEPPRREWGLGLGAKPGMTTGSPSSRSANASPIPPTSDSKWGVGSPVLLISGEHSGLMGRVHEITNASLLINLSASEEIVSVLREHVKLVKEEDLHMPLDLPEDLPSSTIPSWLFPHIQVRVISKGLAAGTLYLKTGEIVDVVTEEDGSSRALVRLHQSGRRVSNLHQSHLRPIPPAVGAMGIVLSGDMAGEGVRVLQVDQHNRDHYLVQTPSSGEILALSRDNLAAFSL